MNRLTSWDFTIGCENIKSRDTLQAFLDDHCKHWAYQMEKGEETGYLHYQGRMSLGLARKQSDLIRLGQSMDLGSWHISPTVTENRLPSDAFYVTKEDTRVDGPWKSTDPKAIVIPRQIREVVELYPWQKQVMDDADIWDTRSINYVFNHEGCIGKSCLCQYLRCYLKGRNIPPVNDYKDIMRMVMDMPVSKLYLVDMPRSIDQKKLAGFFAGIEEVKGGHAWDDRYEFKEKEFDCPNVWVFGNTIPDMKYLSADRWKLWTIKDNKLEPLVLPIHGAAPQAPPNKKQKIAIEEDE